MRTFGLVLLLALAAVSVLAGPTTDDVAVVADGGVRITTTLGNPVGPTMFDFATNGTASVKCMKFKSDITDRVGGQLAWTVTILLRDYTPPRSFYFPSGLDSLYVDLGTATEVIVTR